MVLGEGKCLKPGLRRIAVGRPKHSAFNGKPKASATCWGRCRLRLAVKRKNFCLHICLLKNQCWASDIIFIVVLQSAADGDLVS